MELIHEEVRVPEFLESDRDLDAIRSLSSVQVDVWAFGLRGDCHCSWNLGGKLEQTVTHVSQE